MGMRVNLIFNPGAGDDTQPTLGQIEALLDEAGYKVRSRSIKEKGWQRLLTQKADFIAVAGGDGTVGKVARRLIGTNIPIAVLPMGTANNISKTLGIADMSITQLIPSWKSASRLKFDAGMASGPWGERHFVEGFGTGLLTSSMPKVDSNKTLAQLPDNTVKVAYAQQIFREHLADCPALGIEATLDGRDISGRYLLLEVLNMQYIGPNLFLAPEIIPDNGEFEIVLVGEKHRDKLHDRIKNWQEGERRPPEIVTLRGKHLTIRWDGFKVHFDDKIWPTGRNRPRPPASIEIGVLPEAVEFLLPEEARRFQHIRQE